MKESERLARDYIKQKTMWNSGVDENGEEVIINWGMVDLYAKKALADIGTALIKEIEEGE